MGVLDIFYWGNSKTNSGNGFKRLLRTTDMNLIFGFAEHENDVTVVIYIIYTQTCISHWNFRCQVAV